MDVGDLIGKLWKELKWVTGYLRGMETTETVMMRSQAMEFVIGYVPRNGLSGLLGKLIWYKGDGSRSRRALSRTNHYMFGNGYIIN